MDSEFSESLADWLAKRSSIPVEMAEDSAVPKAGRAYVSRADADLFMSPAGAFGYRGSGGDPFCPSIDFFFKSLVGYGARLRRTPHRNGLRRGGGNARAAGGGCGLSRRTRPRAWFTECRKPPPKRARLRKFSARTRSARDWRRYSARFGPDAFSVLRRRW